MYLLTATSVGTPAGKVPVKPEYDERNEGRTERECKQAPFQGLICRRVAHSIQSRPAGRGTLQIWHEITAPIKLKQHVLCVILSCSLPSLMETSE